MICLTMEHLAISLRSRLDAKTDGISSMVWKYYGYPTLDDLYADVVGDNADYSLVEDAVDNTK